jgi:chorismate mutase
MAHIETGRPRSAIQHVYLRGAAALRLDIAQLGADRCGSRSSGRG